jgi:hypothetical protein
MKFFTALVTLTAFVVAHNGAHDAQGNHLDAQGNIIQYANTNQQLNNQANNDAWVQQLLGLNNNQASGYANNYNGGNGNNSNQPCDHPMQGQQGYNKQY